MRVGPWPSRARPAASRVARKTASASIPSTRTPSKPYAGAFCAKVAEAVCFATGTEIGHWLLLQRKTVGVRKTPAKFIAAWKAAVLVAPSPKKTRTACASPRSFIAQAFFFQAEDGIRDLTVTGVQTCALPI